MGHYNTFQHDTNWEQQVRPGDIVMFNLPKENATFFSKLVHLIQDFVNPRSNSKTHAAMVIETGDINFKSGETQLKVIDIEFGRKVSTYFIPLKYGDFDIYQPFNSELSCTFPDGTATTASSKAISARAAEIANDLKGASYSLGKCHEALTTHKNNQEHMITDEYLNWLRQLNNTSYFMCVSFVLTCYQRACLDLLGGLPPAFSINAHTTPRYFAHHIEKSGHFTKHPPRIIKAIHQTGAAVFHAAPPSRFSWRRPPGYQPLLLGGPSHLQMQCEPEEEEDSGAGLGFFRRKQ